MSDDIDERYRRAAAQEPGRPGKDVRKNILAHARRLADERHAAPPALRAQPAANRSFWRGTAIGTVAAAALAGLLLTPHFRETGVLAPPAAITALASQTPQAAPAPQAPPAPPAAPAPRPATQSSPAVVTPFPGFARRSTPMVRELQAQANQMRELRRQSGAAYSDAARGAAPPTRTLSPARSEPADSGAALRRAARDGDMDQLRTLFESADIDARDDEGRTALMLAAEQGQAAAVEALLAHGADPNAVDAGGSSPLQFARATGRDAVAEILRRGGAR